jgi:hypothetical protein
MKIISIFVAVFVLFFNIAYIAGQNEETIAKINNYRQEIEKKLVDKKLTQKEVSLTGANVKESLQQKWEKMDAYYEGSNLVRIQLYPHKSVSERTEEFYLMDNKLVFAFIQDNGSNEGKDVGKPGKEFYFHNNKLIKFENRSGDPAMNDDQEKKMYETRLPYEVSELLEVLNKK